MKSFYDALSLRIVLIASTISVLVNVGCVQLRAQDLDEDGIEDNVEQNLIDRYCPELFYVKAEKKWPTTVEYFVRHSVLVYVSGLRVFESDTLANDPMSALNGASLCDWAEPSSMTEWPDSTFWRIAPDDAILGGMGPIGVGMYAHVVRISAAVKYQGPAGWKWNNTSLVLVPGTILVQYWQFFAYSDSQNWTGCGDHEGDWLYLDVYVEPTPPNRIQYIVYHHHGDSNCGPTILPWDYPLPDENIPQCYLEEGSHEWWPKAHSCDYEYSDPCDGDGEHYRVSNVLNLGEQFAPMPGIEPSLILLFNGRWGLKGDDCIVTSAHPPEGPTHQYYPAPPLYVAYVDEAASVWKSAGLGSRYHPFRVLGQGCDAVEESGHVRIASGRYLGSITISKAMTLEAWPGGEVAIGP